MLVVLGRPGSGCSTFLKITSGETHGFNVDPKSEINYQGISARQMHHQFRGEAIYTAETDVYFPQLTVGETLSFAARARAPRNRPLNISGDQYAEHMKDVIMTMLGLNHTMNSKVGDDLIRPLVAVKGNELLLQKQHLAVALCITLRLETELSGSTACVAIYQASQDAYEFQRIFDKVILLYEGREIYFGRTQDAKDYFTAMGPLERIVRPGFEYMVPRTADEFAAAWKKSAHHAQLMVDIEDYYDEYPVGGESVQTFENSRRAQQANMRNPAIIFAFMIFYMLTYLFSTEYISAAKSKGEILLFRRGYAPAHEPEAQSDIEKSTDAGQSLDQAMDRQVSATIQQQTAIFQWKDICYDINIKKEPRRILDHLDGWVKPGTLTAAMGWCLAKLYLMGVREMPHSKGKLVREGLQFSALLRQPASTTKQEKLGYVEEVIKLLDMEAYADAVVGVPGEWLNVEQRKRLTIGVELAAKPELVLFLDEPTSGLDSQTSWAILDLLEKLTAHAMLFQRFDRLLFLAAGSKPVYFGEIGPSSSTLTTDFERNEAEPCPPDSNPAEWMIEVIGAAPDTTSSINWTEVWDSSAEKPSITLDLTTLQPSPSKDDSTYRPFAAPFHTHIRLYLIRIFTPILAHTNLHLQQTAPLHPNRPLHQPLLPLLQQQLLLPPSKASKTKMLGIFMLMTIFGNIVQQNLPQLPRAQRSLFEARKRQSKIYSWPAFLLSNILVELPWNTFLAHVAASVEPRVWWRDFGIVLTFSVFNVCAALLFYWLARGVPKTKDSHGEGEGEGRAGRVRRGKGRGRAQDMPT
ncbi:hypothetical protein EPUS_03156 [Endocarpon pusillum Z07020]|uniref:ABC transporter domain-containing protein n=1 Tax=Endocarpon pusillum (strain Z07020 / HMAS-L-300199) TaxID=1263415 RepID=U1GM49_ENDPU|nr:uncharacterized protein EPUS_03156 [Endocarpon pusillum Z07020]ERF73323.1 hypothetical protein EPUS_03156 [Endocarpon pusillum Z07020]